MAGSALKRLLAAAALTLAAAAVLPAYAQAPRVQSEAEFRAFVDGFWPEAERHGIPKPLYDQAFAGVVPDPQIATLMVHQPEFSKPTGAYIAAQVTPGRVKAGRLLMDKWRPDLTAIEARYHVPAAILVAVWGLETNYGASAGRKDVIRSIATLAAMNYRPELYRAELLDALDMLKAGGLTREDLRGSWAGAMGQPQFMPSSFLAYAVDWDHDGRRNIWTSVPDALASIAHFIREKGWTPDRPWGFEVRLPKGLDVGQSRAAFADWTARGVARTDGKPLPRTGQGVLFFPAGIAGPAFLVTENFEVLKTYNFSDAYVLSIGQLADEMAGGAAFAASWPATPPMGRDDRIALQARLAERGYTVDNREGRISLALRDTIRTAQSHYGLTPDGNPTGDLLGRLGAAPH